MPKPRILINMHYMELGGAERSLLGLLNALDTERVDVDLFLNQHTGAFMPLIPKKIHLLPEVPAYSAIERPMKDIFREGHWGVLLGRLVGKWRHSRYLKRIHYRSDGSSSQYAFDGVIPFLPSLKRLGHYDMAISFLDPPHIVQDKVDADLRLEWIHTDWSTVPVNRALVLPRWRRNDYIVSISEAVTGQFLKAFPELAPKIIEIHNILSPDFVRAQAALPEPMPERVQDGSLVLCSVGRVAYLKNFDNIPHMAKALKERGLRFHWYVVGPGDHAKIDETSRQVGVGDCVHFVGPKANPYPWMKACDIYVQPSRYEGHAVTVREAQMLGRPVVITNYPTSRSQVQDGVDGVICPLDNEGVAEAIFALANDEARRAALAAYTASHDYGNEAEVNKLYTLLNI